MPKWQLIHRRKDKAVAAFERARPIIGHAIVIGPLIRLVVEETGERVIGREAESIGEVPPERNERSVIKRSLACIRKALEDSELREPQPDLRIPGAPQTRRQFVRI